MSNLYKISSLYQQAAQELLDMDDLSPEIVADSLASLKDEFEEKALNVAAFCKNLDLDINTLKSYEKAVQEKRRSLESKKNTLEAYLYREMLNTNLQKIKGLEFSLSIKLNPPVVNITNYELVPSEYLQEIECPPDKVKIKNALKEGVEVPGATLSQSARLEIK